MKRVETEQIDGLYTAVYTPPNCLGHILFVHGGPGNHCAYFEYALENLAGLQSMPYGWVVYDQRWCGRSEKTPEPKTHVRNFDDLLHLTKRFVDDRGDIQLRAVFGHSYGGRLAYELCEKNPNLPIKLILAGRARQNSHVPARYTLIDLLVLKMQQPDAYQSVVGLMNDYPQKRDEINRAVRDKMQSTDARKYFYWGNLEAMRWYEQVKSRVKIAEDNEVFREVGGSVDTYNDFEPDRIKQDVLWMTGFHDFMMLGESMDEAKGMVTLFKSGHYPHFEEAEKFVELVADFLR